MLGCLLETFFEVHGELLSTCGRVSFILLFTLSALVSIMSTLMFIGLVTAILLACFFQWSLPKPDKSRIEALISSKGVVFAHRGAALDAPENTLSAIRLAKQNEAFGVEVDLSFTKDSVAVVFHDDELDRTTNGKGLLIDHTWDVVKSLDASEHHIYSDKFPGEKVPTIEQAVDEALRLELKLILDIKEYDDRTFNYLCELFDKYPNLSKEALVASFYPQLLYKIRKRRPDIVTAIIWRKNFLAYHDAAKEKPRFENFPLKQYCLELLDPLLQWAIHAFLWQLTGVSAVLIHKDYISKDYVEMWAKRNIRVLSWTPNNPVEKDFFLHLNVSIITDTLV